MGMRFCSFFCMVCFILGIIKIVKNNNIKDYNFSVRFQVKW